MVRVDIVSSDSHRFTIAEQGLAGMEIEKAVTRFALNQVSGCTLALPSTNKTARVLTGGISTDVEVFDDNRRVFIGSVASVKENILGGLEVECDGALSWLANVVKPPFQVTNRTHASYIETIINQHNAAMVAAGTARKSIWFGGVTGFSGNVDIHHSDEYINTLDLLRECVKIYGGFFFENAGGVTAQPSVGWMREPTISSGQVLEFGVNIASLETMLDFSDFASRVYAINGDGLTVTGGYVVDQDAEDTYGRRDFAYQSQMETQADLDAEASAILTARRTPIRSVEATAAMIKRAGCNFEAMKLGTTVDVLDRKLGVNLKLMVMSIERDHVNVQDGRITLGRQQNTLTGSIGSGGGGSSGGGSSGGGGGAVQNAVLFTVQNLSAAEKAQARQNIGAAVDGAMPTKLSDLTNDMNFVTASGVTEYAPVKSVNGQTGAVVIPTGGAVDSVNGKTGTVNLTAADVGALPSATTIPTKTSDLQNDSGFITSAPVASVNGKTGAVVLSASDVGALPDTYTAPVASVNGKTGTVNLGASDVGALASDAPVLTYASQTLTDAQKAQARANIGAIGNVSANVVYDIYADFHSDSAGNYYTFTGGVTASTILNAINSGMLPIVRRNDNQYKRKWYFSEYNDDGEDVYIQFFRVVRGGVEVMQFIASEGKAYVFTN